MAAKHRELSMAERVPELHFSEDGRIPGETSTTSLSCPFLPECLL